MSKFDYYSVLGLPEDAGPSMIWKAHRRLVLETHPDTHPGDKDAEQRFKEVTEAYEVLKNQGRRAKHDGYVRSPYSLLYLARDVEKASKDPETLEIIAFSKSDETVRRQAATLLLDSDDPVLLSRIASGSFGGEVREKAAAKIAQDMIDELVSTGDYNRVIRLATNSFETSDTRRIATEAAMTIFDRAVASDSVTSEMIEQYLFKLVCGELKRSGSIYGKQIAESIVPTESRVAIGRKIIAFFKGGNRTKELLDLGARTAPYLPRELAGKFTGAVIELHIEFGDVTNLLDFIEEKSHRLGRAQVESIIDGIMKIATETPDSGYSGGLNGLMGLVLRRLEYSCFEHSPFEALVERLIDKALERDDKRCINSVLAKNMPLTLS